MHKGRVKWFNEVRGYGFITEEENGQDLFVHFADIQERGYRTLAEGQEVAFEVTVGDRGPQATNVSKV